MCQTVRETKPTTHCVVMHQLSHVSLLHRPNHLCRDPALQEEDAHHLAD